MPCGRSFLPDGKRRLTRPERLTRDQVPVALRGDGLALVAGEIRALLFSSAAAALPVECRPSSVMFSGRPAPTDGTVPRDFPTLHALGSAG
jgi:hypothetical protein